MFVWVFTFSRIEEKRHSSWWFQHIPDWFISPLLQTFLSYLNPSHFGINWESTDGAQRILSLLCSCHRFHAKSKSLTAPSTPPSPTVDLCNTATPSWVQTTIRSPCCCCGCSAQIDMILQFFLKYRLLLLVWRFEEEIVARAILVAFDHCVVSYIYC